MKNMRDLLPEIYLRLTDIRSGEKFSVEEYIATEQLSVVDVPYSGDVCVTISARDRIPHIEMLAIRQGAQYDLPFSLREMPSISGIVVHEDGSPAVGVAVTVCCKSLFLDEFVPRVENEPGNPEFVLIGKNGQPGQYAYAQLERQTDGEGRFRIRMPYSDQVAAWVFTEDSKGIDVTSSEVRESSVDDLRVVLRPYPVPGPRMRIVNSKGVIQANRVLRPLEVDPPHPFQMLYPQLTTDADGYFDASSLEVGVHYALVGVDVQDESFVVSDGATITLR